MESLCSIWEGGRVPPKGVCQWRSWARRLENGCGRAGSGRSTKAEAEAEAWAPIKSPITGAMQMASVKELDQNKGIWITREVSRLVGGMRSGKILLGLDGTAVHGFLYPYILANIVKVNCVCFKRLGWNGPWWPWKECLQTAVGEWGSSSELQVFKKEGQQESERGLSLVRQSVLTLKVGGKKVPWIPLK